MAWELRPTALDDLGLETAITQYLEEWGERSRLHFDLQVSLGDRRLPQTVETTVYRALQEAVTNVVRHADAGAGGRHPGSDRAATATDRRGRRQGVSRRTRPTVATQRPLRLGLLGIRERLALVGGTLEVESTPGLGTTLFVRVPV